MNKLNIHNWLSDKPIAIPQKIPWNDNANNNMKKIIEFSKFSAKETD